MKPSRWLKEFCCLVTSMFLYPEWQLNTKIHSWCELTVGCTYASRSYKKEIQHNFKLRVDKLESFLKRSRTFAQNQTKKPNKLHVVV